MNESEKEGGGKMNNESYVSKIKEETRIMLSILAERKLRRKSRLIQSPLGWPIISEVKDGALLNN